MTNELELIDVREGVHYNTSEDNNMSEKIINITSLRKDLYKISESVITDGEIYNVTTKNGVLVMVSKEEYDALIETLYLSNNLLGYSSFIIFNTNIAKLCLSSISSF